MSDESEDFDVGGQAETLRKIAVLDVQPAIKKTERQSQVSQAQPPKLPDDLNESFALLRIALAMPTRNSREEWARECAVRPIKAHIMRLQQGLPVIAIGANEFAAAHGKQDAINHRKIVEDIARSNISVKRLLEAHDKLVEAHDKLVAESESKSTKPKK